MNKNEGVERCDAFRLIEALTRSGKSTELRLDGALAPLGLSSVQWSVLRNLVEAGRQLALGQLASRLACVKSNATQLVDRLEASGLVRRTADPDDRRSVRAELTAAGRHCYAAGLEIVEEFERRLLEDFTLEERVLLNRILTRLSRVETLAG